jgi:hypothetical protein
LGGLIKAPKWSRRKSSSGEAISTNPNKMDLVRSKNPARAGSDIWSSVEIAQAGYDFGSNSISDSVAFDSNCLSPHRTRSPSRRSVREAPMPTRNDHRAKNIQRDTSHSRSVVRAEFLSLTTKKMRRRKRQRCGRPKDEDTLLHGWKSGEKGRKP